jgi:hypothetical protein
MERGHEVRLRNWRLGGKKEASMEDSDTEADEERKREEEERRRKEEAKKKPKPYGGYFGEHKGYGKKLQELDEE